MKCRGRFSCVQTVLRKNDISCKKRMNSTTTATLTSTKSKELPTRRMIFDSIGKELGIRHLDDWYNFNAEAVRKRANFLFTNNSKSLYTTLQQIYPEHPWDPIRFHNVPTKYWKSVDHQKLYLDRLATEIGVKELDDWYKVNRTAIKNKATFVNTYYNGSLYDALAALYPHHRWDPLRFSIVPKKFWKKPGSEKVFNNLIREWQQQYNIHQLSDWYHVPPSVLKILQRGSRSLFGGVSNMFKQLFPTTNWSYAVQSSHPELYLQNMLSSMVDIKVHHKIGPYSVDIYIDSWKVAIEYQGEQHFKQGWRGELQSESSMEWVMVSTVRHYCTNETGFDELYEYKIVNAN